MRKTVRNAWHKNGCVCVKRKTIKKQLVLAPFKDLRSPDDRSYDKCERVGETQVDGKNKGPYFLHDRLFSSSNSFTRMVGKYVASNSSNNDG